MKFYVEQTMYMKEGRVVKSTSSNYPKKNQVLNVLGMSEAFTRDFDHYAREMFKEKKIDHILILVWGVEENGCYTLLDGVNKQFSYYHLKSLFKESK